MLLDWLAMHRMVINQGNECGTLTKGEASDKKSSGEMCGSNEVNPTRPLQEAMKPIDIWIDHENI